MSSHADQAAGLRRWLTDEQTARRKAAEPTPRTRLMVVGLPGTSPWHVQWVQQRLADWHQSGARWVGDPEGWLVEPLAADHPELVGRARQEKRWALWVETGLEAFPAGYRTLQALALQPAGPRRLLALHPPGWLRRGLLGNLRHVAATEFGIELLVLAR